MDYGVTSLPAAEDGTKTTVLGGEVFGVTNGRHKEAAIEFLRYISDKDRMSEYMERSSYMAPRADVLEDQYKGNALKRSMIQLTQSARLREFTVEWPYISQVITDTMEAEIIGDRIEDELITESAARMKEIREENR